MEVQKTRSDFEKKGFPSIQNLWFFSRDGKKTQKFKTFWRRVHHVSSLSETPFKLECVLDTSNERTKQHLRRSRSMSQMSRRTAQNTHKDGSLGDWGKRSIRRDLFWRGEGLFWLDWLLLATEASGAETAEWSETQVSEDTNFELEMELGHRNGQNRCFFFFGKKRRISRNEHVPDVIDNNNVAQWINDLDVNGYNNNMKLAKKSSLSKFFSSVLALHWIRNEGIII